MKAKDVTPGDEIVCPKTGHNETVTTVFKNAKHRVITAADTVGIGARTHTHIIFQEEEVEAA